MLAMSASFSAITSAALTWRTVGRAVFIPKITGRELFDAVVGGAEAGCTMPVGAEVAGRLLRPGLLAVSWTRIVSPTSAAASV